ncbi:hypothetical protein Kpol_526p51 [Vanderwaltozyma polyspora DSM 70294]|uniref:Sphingoid long-chain base transporter RSB1 n=1 Tax=Vanderwaltozyma polyspora (strain ATCC 22028 / DSM 70294 / BCRC 21397 / CBS 2163 / NBRC 10782 / NRRL Y-8283 / UCD 57-17) TaxID=436907 RepID=A7TLV6_VANPO|nr:uncharacterized protein Kpol_526p51 [Vanderwaltozyma polyspora DSM 70294]EDO16798.1 hypothetical protein Kpol_526p51 [Vanderwaltozyma polyspora DSM 70294]
MSNMVSKATVDFVVDQISNNATTFLSMYTSDQDTSDSYYSGLVPNLGYNVAMIVIWGILLGIHVLFLYYKQYWFAVTLICTGILEVLGYIGRTWSHYNVYAMNGYLLQMVSLTIAPIFLMAGMYYQLAKLIEVYSHRYSLLPSPMAYSQLFIVSDIVSLVVQAAGGGISGEAVDNFEPLDKGEHVFVAGLALQVASMSIFIFLWLHFVFVVFYKPRMDFLNIKNPFLIGKIWKVKQVDIDPIYREKYHFLRNSDKKWNKFTLSYFCWAFTVATCCIFARCAYRLAELVDGFQGYIITHEDYFIVLDGVMIAFATVIMTVFYPGFAFDGRNVSIPITKGRVDPETVAQDDVESGRFVELTNSSNDGTIEEKEDTSSLFASNKESDQPAKKGFKKLLKFQFKK